MNLFLDLYLTYLKISFASFGGLSMVPLVNQEMLNHGWMTASEVGDIVAIAEMTPGPLALNCASFVGLRVGGGAGAFFATLGVLTPSLTLAFLGAVMLEKFKKSTLLTNLMYGIRSAALGMIISTIFTLSITNYLLPDAINVQALIIGVLDLYLLLKRKWKIPAVIFLSAALGCLIVR